MLQFRLERFDTRVDEVLLVTDEHGRVRALDFGDYEERLLRLLRLHYGSDAVALVEHADAVLEKTAARRALEAYLVGNLRGEADLQERRASSPKKRPEHLTGARVSVVTPAGKIRFEA